MGKTFFFMSLIINIAFSICFKIEPKTVPIAVIEITGLDSDDFGTINSINTACDSDTYAAVLLIINSPGGSSAIARHLMCTLEKCSLHKIVMSFILETCASAAFQIAAVTDYIVASPTALIGSIGIISSTETYSNISKSSNESTLDLSLTTFKVPIKKRERCDHINLYEDFKEIVIRRRPEIAAHNPEIWAEGKIFAGHRALKLKLIDSIGSFSEAIEHLQFLFRKRGIPVKEEDFTFVTLD